MHQPTKDDGRPVSGRSWLLAALACGVALAAGCGNRAAQNAATATATGSAAGTGTARVRTDGGLRQQVIDAQRYQIEHSNLPADQKQRALQQLQATVPR